MTNGRWREWMRAPVRGMDEAGLRPPGISPDDTWNAEAGQAAPPRIGPHEEGIAPMSKPDHPITPAVRLLRDRKVAFIPRQYPFVEHGGTKHASEILGVPEHAVIKTLVMETETRQGLLVLMHGDEEVSTKHLARILDVKRVTPCDVATAQKLTGYLVGGISPFGTRKEMPVYVEKTVLTLDRIFINGGKRGFLFEMNPRDLSTVLNVTAVETAIP